MNHLALQKQLLVAESELNRMELKKELGELAADLHACTTATNSISTLVTSAKVLMTGLGSVLRAKRAAAGEKTSWWRSLRSEFALASILWKAFRPMAKSRDQN
jgi:hypothetical protein